ncbi:MerR family transcriptional regulator [Nonomuraea sp. NBC_00507]|uniref:MerR family transcriptional regulator n=1 Tax=Nonomuraea sp. NBC_00507 TaxID=2976002 RepID=UPI002E177FA9
MAAADYPARRSSGDTDRRARLSLDDEHAPLYSIGQVTTMLEVQHAFLRRLEEYQLVRPQRSAGGQRRYSRRDIEHLQQVVGLIEEGMSLVAVRRILYLQRQLTSARRQRDHLRRDAPREKHDTHEHGW